MFHAVSALGSTLQSPLEDHLPTTAVSGRIFSPTMNYCRGYPNAEGQTLHARMSHPGRGVPGNLRPDLARRAEYGRRTTYVALDEYHRTVLAGRSYRTTSCEHRLWCRALLGTCHSFDATPI